ncbi:MAG: HAMP domain-containing protein [Leptospiraceae bacterium]|nr:HAMP domain-containing protein [Leptospiraceae bacterium]
MLSEEEKKAKIAKEDEEYKAREIKFGIRYKLILLFSILIFSIALGITLVATAQQSASLLEEKQKQGTIINRALTASVKTRLLDIYATNQNKLESFSSDDDFINFYQDNTISELIFEDVDAVIKQPDVVYAYILGKHNIVLGHTNPQIPPYSKYQFEEGVSSYLDRPENQGKNGLKPILTDIVFKKNKRNPDGEEIIEEIETIDFSYLLAFRDNANLEDAVGEVHIGISLESVNAQIFETKVQLQIVGIVAILFGIGTAVIFASFIARPIRRVTEGMNAVAQGDFHASVLVKSKDEVGRLSRTFNIMLKGMSILVSPEVAQVVLAGGDLLKGGQKRIVTVLFSDVRGFTTISESLTPHEVVEMLNGYLEIMTDIIIKYGGVVDKFVGDEIFAVFGAPFDHPMHPLCSCATALEMGRELAAHNDSRMKEGRLPIEIGIGINTGEVIAGAMGSTKRIDYTSIGDAVNLGARLEGTNKVYGTLCIISEFTYEIVKDDIICRELDAIRVKGKNEPVTIYEVVGLTESGETKVNGYLAEKATAEEKKVKGSLKKAS